MRRNRREAGEGNFGCIVGLVILVAAVFIAFKIIPVKANMADLRQTCVDEGKSAGQHSDAVIMKAILAKADDEHLPVTEDNVTISRQTNTITIDVDYVVPVQFPGYTYQWHEHHHVENPIF
ncbi:MAG TPA: hypothetical protein VGJ88_10320 [Thermoanaerobaculia bacterium]|jgi:hypothetical protein